MKGSRRSFRYSFLFGDICGAYAIRPYPDGRMDTGGSIGNPIFLMKGSRRFFRYSFLFGNICGAYAIRPYPDGRMDARDLFVIHFHLWIVVGHILYAPTLTDEWMPED